MLSLLYQNIYYICIVDECKCSVACSYEGKKWGKGFEMLNMSREGMINYSMDHRRLFDFSSPIFVIGSDEAPVAVAVAWETIKKGVLG